MAAVINTNIASLNAQRNLSTSQSQLATSLQRLSSGLRINSAKDDAAGLAISERFSTQIRGMNVAARNANDGISLAQSAEGAMTEIGNNLQRIRELAVQSRNATNSASDRAALNAEATQLKDEIDRVATTTAFNGTKLLNGSFTAQSFQVGANQGETIDISAIVNASSSALGSWTSVATPATPVAGAAPTGTGGSAGTPATPATNAMGAFTASAGGDGTSTFTATFDNGAGASFNVAVTGAVDATSLAAAYATAGFNSDGTGTVQGFTLDLGAQTTIADAITNGTLTVERADGVDFTYAEVESGTAYGTSGGFNAAPAASADGVPAVAGTAATFTALTGSAFTINGTNIEVTGGAADATEQMTKLLTAINAQTTATGVTATNVGGALTLTATGGTGEINIGGTAGAATVAGSVLAETGLTIGNNAAVAGTAQTGFNTLDISTATGADNAILAMDGALTAINTARANMGAIQNRFTSVVASLQTTSENMSASRSRILDADFAAETANLTRGQILQQAGTAMLAQANSLPNGVLALLRG